MRKILPHVASLFSSYLAFVVAAALAGTQPTAAGVLLLVATTGGVAAEAILWRRPTVWTALRRISTDSTLRAGLRDLMLVAFAAAAHNRRPELLDVAVPVLVTVWALRTVVILLQRNNVARRSLPVAWRNLEVRGVRQTGPIGPGAFSDAAGWPSSGSLPLALGLGASAVTAKAEWSSVGALLSVALAGAVAVLTLVDTLRAQRDTSAEGAVEALARALAVHAPTVILYYSRPERIGYIANVWVHTLEQLPHRVAVVVREHHNADLLATDTLPVVTITRATDLERVIPPSVQLALYPSNVANNNHLLRLPGIFDVFVGHGDSDKGGSATTLTRAYDEAWVSGPAARDRYHVADVGVRDEQIREVGRPQLAEIVAQASQHPAAADEADWDYTVLYAPTREGFFAAWEYSSILTQAAGILTSLLGMPGVRVLFKPHPGTGTDDRVYGEEVDRLKELVVAAGAPHEVVTGSEGLYHAFNRADLLVSDVSSVITDFLASGKPYVVTNSGDLGDAEFRQQFPSAGGAYILTGDGTDVARLVGEARTKESMRRARTRTAAYLLGRTDDPLGQFSQAIDTVLTAQRAAAASRT